MKCKIMMLAAALISLQSPAEAQNISEWDQNQDGEITRDEFTAGFQEAGLFETWDRNADNSVTALELAEGLYAFWDRNGDGGLFIEEWENAVDLWLGEGDVDLSASAWDADGDGVISEFEFASAFQQTNLIAEFSSDDGVFHDEDLSASLFASADQDEDEVIPISEGGFFATAAEMLDDPVDMNMNLIEAGEAFTQLPIPCGSGNDCQQIAGDFCSALGYGAPIDTLAVDGQLYVVRCTDDPLN